MATLKDAVALLEQGEWETAHAIAQKDGSALGSWAHGIVHVMEGDLRNAGHWYRRAGRELPEEVDVEAEVAALKGEVG